jgi:DNA-directed RNA polymerase subunit N (RpoN/RPB10)
MISSDLSWDSHVTYMLSKVSKRMYCIHNLIRAGVSARDLIDVYCSIIRSVLEYACPVWHPGLSKSQTKEIERVQKRFFRLVFPNLTYLEALSAAGVDKLCTRRELLTQSMFREIKNEQHVLHSLLPKRDLSSSMTLRSSYPYHIAITKSTRYGRSFIPYCISQRY